VTHIFRNGFNINYFISDDHKVSKLELDTAWKANGFNGSDKDSDVLFGKLDFDHDGFLTGSHDMTHWFSVYDANSKSEILREKDHLALKHWFSVYDTNSKLKTLSINC